MSPASRTFTLLGGRLVLEDVPPRPPEDALWLAAAYTPKPNARVLDAMCGAGIVGLALLARCPRLHVTSLDLDPALAALAARNAARNNLALQAVTGDVATYHAAPFDAVFCNPPFHAAARGHTASTAERRRAKSLPALEPWLAALHRLATPQGTLLLMLHADCKPDLTAFAERSGCAATLWPLQTASTRPPKRLLARLDKGRGFSLTEKPPVAAFDKHLREAVLVMAKALPPPGEA
jgi:tRNA1(Val) A37 N6-methylase TrmN6